MALSAAAVAELVCPDFAVITQNNVYFGEQPAAMSMTLTVALVLVPGKLVDLLVSV
jgi:hypothetical protein